MCGLSHHVLCTCVFYRLLDVYQCMKSDGHLPSLDIIHLVLRGGSCTDDRYSHVQLRMVRMFCSAITFFLDV